MRSTYLIETIVYLSKFSSFATSYLGKVLLYARLEGREKAISSSCSKKERKKRTRIRGENSVAQAFKTSANLTADKFPFTVA